MKQLLLILLTGFFAFSIDAGRIVDSSLKHNADKNSADSNTIKWSSDYKLKFEDFLLPKFDPDFYQRHYGDQVDSSKMTIYAYSYLSILYSFKFEKQKTIVDAFATFNRRKSWIGDRSENTLLHEQGHFDLTEIYARKFEKRMEAYQNVADSEFWRVFNMEYKEIDAQHWKQQREFDEVCKTGYVSEKLYLEKITHELKSQE